jgi:hypothetical protein
MTRSRTRLQMGPNVGEAMRERLLTPHPSDLSNPRRNVARNYGREVGITQNSILYHAHTFPAASRLALVKRDSGGAITILPPPNHLSPARHWLVCLPATRPFP